MKKLVVVAALIAAVTGAAHAADPVVMPPVVVEPDLFDWSGLYVGGFVGGGMASFPTVSSPSTHPLDAFDPISASGWLIGGQIGGDWQIDNVIVGVVAEGAWAGIDGSIVTADPEWQASLDWYAALSAKLGFAVNRAQLYGKAGVAGVGVTLTGIDNVASTTATASNTNLGFLLGAGVEFAVNDRVSIFAEGNWIGTAAANYDITGTGFHSVESVSPGVGVAKIGVNFRM